MKTSAPLSRFTRLSCAVSWLAGLLIARLCAQDLPEITQVRLDQTNLLVAAHAPAGLRKLTLESRPRVGDGTWSPQAVLRLDGNGGTVTFRIVRSAQLEVLRVRADATEPLPASFYTGTNAFIGGLGNGSLRGDILEVTPGAGGGTDSGSTRTVVESDIWKLSGDTLYFFNQYRGLQVINVADPAAPQLRGTLSLPAVGEQMYLLDSYAVLLTRDCNNSPSTSAVLVVDTAEAVPRVVARLPVDGTIQESRLVGSALYVASETYRPVPPVTPNASTTWEWGTFVTSLDLASRTAPVVKDTLWFAGSGNVVTATDRFLFVATRDPANWWHSFIRVIDISDAHGTMLTRSTLSPRGQVPDKFKMNLSGEVFTVVSESWAERSQWTSVLENFSLADPSAPTRLASLVVKAGERLFATRFDGQRAYVVTFQRIDPLFVIDLADPTRPRVAGELEVPGWSTYIHPLGDRLVAIGIDNTNGWRVAVSLFDVQDPAAPKLLSRVPVGENYSWSEANTDEKAFGILPEIGLLLVPYQGYTTNGYASRVQLIDLAADRLTARGFIEHSLVPRRATVHRDRVLSLSGRELLSVNATDRDHPALLASLPLSWRVDRVLAAGAYVIELTSGNSWDVAETTVRVASVTDPDQPLQQLTLGPLPVLGAAIEGDRLLVLQGKTEWWWPAADGTEPKPSTDTNAILSVLNLANLPTLTLSGSWQGSVPPLGWGTDWKPQWAKPGVVVWAGGGGYWGWWGRGGIAIDAMPIGGWWAPWYGGQGGRLLAFDVSNPSAPRLASDVNLITNDRWNFSGAFLGDGLVFLSHETSEFLEGVVPPDYVRPAPTITKDPVTGQLVTNEVPIGTWVQRYYLDVVDYSDPTQPAVRKPVSLPGRLGGIAQGGALLYTSGPQFDPVKWTTDGNEWLSACAYDGVSTYRVDSLALPTTWPHPWLALSGQILIARAADATGGNHVLESWVLGGAGGFLRQGAVPLTSPAQELYGFGDLLLIRGTVELGLYRTAASSPPTLLDRQAISGCLWPDLSKASAAADGTLWMPLGDYGVGRLPQR